MLFTEKDLLNAFKQNIDNKGWIYFVGNPESNAKFIIDCMKANKEEISEEELDELAEEYAEQFDFVDSKVKYACKKDFKAGCRKIIENSYEKHF